MLKGNHMTGFYPRSIIFCMALLFIGLSACAKGAEERKSLSTYFESTYIDAALEFDTKSVNLGSVEIIFPLPKKHILNVQKKKSTEDEYYVLNVKHEAKAAFTVFIRMSNIIQDNGKMYEIEKKRDYDQFLDKSFEKEVVDSLVRAGVECTSASPVIFETHYEYGYLYRLRTICKVLQGDYRINVALGSIHVKSCSLSFLALDYYPDEELGGMLINTWFKAFLECNLK